MGRQTRTLTSARATYDALNTAPESLGSESGKALLAALGTAQVAYRSAAPPVVKTGRTLESKLIRFMQKGPHIDYPEREVMYRWDADTNTLFQKYYSQRLSADGVGTSREHPVSWVDDHLNEMLDNALGSPLPPKEYDTGKLGASRTIQ